MWALVVVRCRVLCLSRCLVQMIAVLIEDEVCSGGFVVLPWNCWKGFVIFL